MRWDRHLMRLFSLHTTLLNWSALFRYNSEILLLSPILINYTLAEWAFSCHILVCEQNRLTMRTTLEKKNRCQQKWEENNIHEYKTIINKHTLYAGRPMVHCEYWVDMPARLYYLIIVQSCCGHFSDNLKIITSEGFSMQNVSLVSLEWHIETWLRLRNGKYIFWGTKKGVVFRIFWYHFTFNANQVVVIEDTVLVTQPNFRLFIVITPYQIHLRNINKKKWEKCSKFDLKFGVILTTKKWNEMNRALGHFCPHIG